MNTKIDRSLTPAAGNPRPIIDTFRVITRIVATLMATAITTATTAAAAPVDAKQSLGDIRAAAERHVSNLARGTHSGDVSVSTARLDPRLNLAACEEPLETFDNQRGRLGSHVSVGIRCNGAKPWTLYVPVTVSAWTRVITVVSAQSRGSILNASDLTVTEQRALTQVSPFVSDMASAVGMELVRPVPAGTPLTLSMLAKPDIVKRGDEVTMVYEGDLLRVTMSGQALQDGASGDRIRLRNPRSKTTVEGEVQNDGTIRIF